MLHPPGSEVPVAVVARVISQSTLCLVWWLGIEGMCVCMYIEKGKRKKVEKKKKEKGLKKKGHTRSESGVENVDVDADVHLVFSHSCFDGVDNPLGTAAESVNIPRCQHAEPAAPVVPHIALPPAQRGADARVDGGVGDQSLLLD